MNQKTPLVRIPLHLYKSGQERYNAQAPIGLLWQVLNDNLFSVFPLALDHAVRMSKERDEKGGEKSFSIDEK